jgi:hypothetical protein
MLHLLDSETQHLCEMGLNHSLNELEQAADQVGLGYKVIIKTWI